MQIPFLSVAVKGWQYATKTFAKERRSYRLWQQLRSFFAALIYPATAAKWFSVIESPGFLQVTQHRPRLYFKPFRVYMSILWSTQKRVKVILDTYRFISSKGNIVLKRMLQTSGIVIAGLVLDDVTDGILTLGYDDRFRKEGEFVMSFDSKQLGGRIVAASFSFEEIEPESMACRIGCIQGHAVNDSNSSKAAQKLMHGLRPKALVVYAIQELSRQMGCTAVYGAGDEIQAYRKKHFIHLSKRHAIQFDYNAIWAECGGQPNKEGWYELPLVPVRKSMEEIKSHKRALYKRRYQMLDDISFQITKSVNEILG
jgi:Uncharacterized protein conserved in bacteria